MQLLFELKDSDIGLSENENFETPYTLRKAVRAVIFNDKGEIAILNVSKRNYHKLPGGGIEAGEDIETALRREVLEETGSHIQITDEIGAIIEYRNQVKLLQISYCFIARTTGHLSETSFTEGEKANGFELIWAEIDDVISLMEKDSLEIYNGKFVQKRDLAVLRIARQMIKTS
ncbi:MAG: NUDIX domain-containing protein [Patescibacteria group bacterium]|nr:NUDIX domain-containing protein [Patescibacteria group bacterium]